MFFSYLFRFAFIKEEIIFLQRTGPLTIQALGLRMRVITLKSDLRAWLELSTCIGTGPM